MTPFSTVRRVGAPLASAGATALLFTGALWVQHARGAWPFTPAPSAQVEGLTGMETTSGADAANTRVAVEASAARSLDIRLETVGRQSLAESVRAVATIVPDESRISHVHTRVSGWIEHLDVNTTGEIVRAGQALAHIFSQELLSSQTEYLAARRNAAASGITRDSATTPRSGTSRPVW